MRPCMYRFFNQKDEIIYVGISKDFTKRLSQHKKTAYWFEEVATIKLFYYDCVEDAIEDEKIVINTEKPIYNSQKKYTWQEKYDDRVLREMGYGRRAPETIDDIATREGWIPDQMEPKRSRRNRSNLR
jgi:predicted GIY-YIG superfamily endonuclease